MKQTVGPSSQIGGVSSFGYSGTISHAVLQHLEAREGNVEAAPSYVFRRRVFLWYTPVVIPTKSLQERAQESSLAQDALDKALGVEKQVPSLAQVVVIGAGLAGLIIGVKCLSTYGDLAILEKTSTAGGTWRHYGNAFSRVNSSEPSYRLSMHKEEPNTNHSYRSEILQDLLRLMKDHGLTRRICTQAEIRRALPTRAGWLLEGTQDVRHFTLACETAVLCTNRRLGMPRQMHFNGEESYVGAVCRGLSDDFTSVVCAEKRVVIVGMGAFAIELMRTSFERTASHVTVLCRRRGTVCPQVIDWVNFIRPFNSEGRRDPVGDAVVLSHWQKTYDDVRAARPECWGQGILKPEGHTVSTSDMFFIAHRLEKCGTELGEVAYLEQHAIMTNEDCRLAADVVIKCVGFELNEGNERLLGRVQMRCTGLVERKLWLQVEAHLDSRFFNSPFGSSYLSIVHFNSELMLRYLCDDDLAVQMAQMQVPLVRMNYFTASESLQSTSLLATTDPEVPKILERHLAMISSAFHLSMTPEHYVSENRRLWDATFDIMAQEARTRYSYPFVHFFDELPDVLCSDSVLQEPNKVAKGAALQPEQVLKVARDAIGGSSQVDADSSLIDAGLDSLAATELRSWLSTRLGVEVPAVSLFEFPSARLLVNHFTSSLESQPPPAKKIMASQILEIAKGAIGGAMEIDDDTALIEAGLDSLAATEVRAWLTAQCGIDVPAVTLFDFPSSRSLATHLNSLSQVRTDAPLELQVNVEWAAAEIANIVYESEDGLVVFRQVACKALEHRDNLRSVLRWMFHRLFGDRPQQYGIMSNLFFDLALSPSGSDVFMSPAETNINQNIGVLILGYAGSSGAMLQPLRDFYVDGKPLWRVVSLTSVFDAGIRDIQQRKALSLLEGVEQIVVHSMSNHGHSTWLQLLEHSAFECWHPRLKAVIFDCGPVLVQHLPANVRVDTVANIAFSAALEHGLNLKRPQQEMIQTAAFAVDWQWQTEDDIKKQVDKEPAVPTLCLFGSSDKLFNKTAADSYTKMLSQARNENNVSSVCLQGDHCRLLQNDADAFVAAVWNFLSSAGLP